MAFRKNRGGNTVVTAQHSGRHSRVVICVGRNVWFVSVLPRNATSARLARLSALNQRRSYDASYIQLQAKVAFRRTARGVPNTLTVILQNTNVAKLQLLFSLQDLLVLFVKLQFAPTAPRSPRPAPPKSVPFAEREEKRVFSSAGDVGSNSCNIRRMMPQTRRTIT